MLKRIITIVSLGFLLLACNGGTTTVSDDKCIQLPGMPLPASCSRS